MLGEDLQEGWELAGLADMADVLHVSLDDGVGMCGW